MKFYAGSKLRLNTVRHVTSIGPSITPVSTIDEAMHQLYQDGPETSQNRVRIEARMPETRQKRRRNEVILNESD